MLIKVIYFEGQVFLIYFLNGKKIYIDKCNIKILMKWYFNSRLFLSDYRFVSDLEYIFFVQYIVVFEEIFFFVFIVM